MDHKEHLVRLAHLVRLERLVNLDKLVHLVLPEILAHREVKECLVFLEPLDKLEPKEHRVHWVQLALLVKLDRQVFQAQREQKEILVTWVPKVHWDKLVSQEQLESLDQKVQPETKVDWVAPVASALLVRLVPVVPAERWVPLAGKEQLVPRDQRDRWAGQDRRVTWVNKELLVQLVILLKVKEVPQDLRDLQAIKVFRAKTELLAQLVQKVNKEQLDQWARQVELDNVDQQVQPELQVQLGRVVQLESSE